MGLQSTDLIPNSVLNALPTATGNEHQANVQNAYSEDGDAAIEGVGKAPGVNSMFNPFNVFRYSKFGLNTETYNKDAHYDFDSNVSPTDVIRKIGLPGVANAVDDVSNTFKSFADQQQATENPTASEIVNWAKATGKGDGTNTQSPTPYTSTDFIWCKYYGKVPNNRMVTLRRYPIPIEDNIMIADEKSPLIPLAQAVTWYGKDVDNELKNIINLDWGFAWKALSADVKDVAGNEIDVDSVLKELNISGTSAAAKAIKTQLFGIDASTGKFDMAALTGYKAKMQKYAKDLYGDNGPYWNRILGPVNVVNETLIRQRGFKKLEAMPEIKLQFDYSLRSYRGVNPKVAFLDLLTNFLSLTYSTAPFWGGDIRYFENPGVQISSLGMEKDLLSGNVVKALQSGVEAMAGQAGAGLAQITGILAEISELGAIGENDQFTQGSLNRMKAVGEIKDGTPAADRATQNIAAMFADKLGAFMQKPLMYRSILDGRAIGEWHMVVGNPMNPIAMMGNLVISDVKLEVGEVLGLDDFPTEFTFKVSLKHARIRAKQDIESIFNLGNGRMSYSPLSKPSSASDSYGQANTDKINAAAGVTAPKSTSAVSKSTTDASEVSAEAINKYRARVHTMYGGGFAESGILPDYFTDYKIKD